MTTPVPLRLPILSALCAGLLLAACGDGAEPTATPPAAPERRDPVAAPDDLPLTPGVYVLKGEDCAHPANAGFRVFDGRGISGSATRDCRVTVRSREGEVYRVDQSCVDTYSGERTTTGQTIRAGDPQSFTLIEDGETTAMTFRLCPAGQAPSYLEDLAKAD